MSLKPEHEIHQRRKGRNVGVGLMLAGFVVLIMEPTVATCVTPPKPVTRQNQS